MLHNYLSFPFTHRRRADPVDVDRRKYSQPGRPEWLKRGGGIVGDDHPPAYRFNAGQKMIYWIVVLGGSAVAVSGYVLMFPFYGTGIAGMQIAQIVHGVVAVLFVAAMLGHIYIGTIGMEGAFEAMGDRHRRPQLGEGSTIASGWRMKWPAPVPTNHNLSRGARRRLRPRNS